MLDLMYEIPSRDDVEECVINEEVIGQGLRCAGAHPQDRITAAGQLSVFQVSRFLA